jgi:hypothetical protein
MSRASMASPWANGCSDGPVTLSGEFCSRFASRRGRSVKTGRDRQLREARNPYLSRPGILAHHSGLWRRFGTNTATYKPRAGGMEGYFPVWMVLHFGCVAAAEAVGPRLYASARPTHEPSRPPIAAPGSSQRRPCALGASRSARLRSAALRTHCVANSIPFRERPRPLWPD